MLLCEPVAALVIMRAMAEVRTFVDTDGSIVSIRVGWDNYHSDTDIVTKEVIRHTLLVD